MAIQSMTVWHGPVHALFAAQVHERDDTALPVLVQCRDTSPNSLPSLVPDGDIFGSDTNSVSLFNLHSWKADEVAKAMTFLHKHPLDLVVTITSDNAPTKAVKDRATQIHDSQVPKSAAAFAKQIEDWLLDRQRGMEPNVAKKLVDLCSPSPEMAQRAAVTLASQPAGQTITWEIARAVAIQTVSEQRPLWDLGSAIATGDAATALNALALADNQVPFVIMRYLENRYRLALLGVSHVPFDEIQESFPKDNKWALDKTLREMPGLTPVLCQRALSDIAQSFEMVLDGASGKNAGIAIEHCIITLAARHRQARR